MRLHKLLVAVLSAALAVGAAAQTASPEQKAAAKEKFQSMTPEQKAEAKQKAKARWESMTPEQQAAAKKRFAETHPRAAERLKEKEAATK